MEELDREGLEKSLEGGRLLVPCFNAEAHGSAGPEPAEPNRFPPVVAIADQPFDSQ